MKLQNKYIAIDIETTDLDPKLGDVIQIGAVVLNEDLSTGEEFMIYIKPTSLHRNPEAMEINGISEMEMSIFPDHHQALENFENFCFSSMTNPLLASWGINFDTSFLEAYYRKLGRIWPFGYRHLDLRSVAIWEAAKAGKQIEKASSNVFLEAYGLKFEGQAHDALDDIKNAVRIIQTL